MRLLHIAARPSAVCTNETAIGIALPAPSANIEIFFVLLGQRRHLDRNRPARLMPFFSPSMPPFTMSAHHIRATSISHHASVRSARRDNRHPGRTRLQVLRQRRKHRADARRRAFDALRRNCQQLLACFEQHRLVIHQHAPCESSAPAGPQECTPACLLLSPPSAPSQSVRPFARGSHAKSSTAPHPALRAPVPETFLPSNTKVPTSPQFSPAAH